MSNLCNFSFWTLASTGKYIMVKNVIDIILSYRKFYRTTLFTALIAFALLIFFSE